MKKFICSIPLQPDKNLYSNQYEIVGNPNIKCNKKSRFPIMTLIDSYAEAEEIRVVAIYTDYEMCKSNLQLFKEEFAALQFTKQFSCPNGVELVQIPHDEQVSNHIATFQKLINYVDDNDELYVCITYGSKLTPIVEIMAIQYAYRIKQNATIGCIVYGQFDHSTKKARIYDVTELIQLDEIIRGLAQDGVTNPKEVLDQIIQNRYD